MSVGKFVNGRTCCRPRYINLLEAHSAFGTVAYNKMVNIAAHPVPCERYTAVGNRAYTERRRIVAVNLYAALRDIYASRVAEGYAV